ncbi:aminodeoxychorismate lyase [Arthrobacter sp. Sa2BUA2]|uniref:Aminodeoxychorismate lyase n=1 Tax=Arthrobacter pullicola TaxID=2762224 RepID=A0ABR8YK80_9MICC|nr:aminodeoxychorismate lyase [Arthrobacter pullicola]MBD8044609.1 aminodeoxychorismate lyase [Arthrobacter pullicola]
MSVLVFLDTAFPAGRVADASVPQLLATDLGATRGDGVFESMLAVDGHPRKLASHLARMAGSAAALRLEFPPPERWEPAIRTALAEFARVYGDQQAVVKLLLTRGPEGAGQPTAWVQASPVPPSAAEQRRTGLDVLLLDRGYDSTVAERAPWLLLGSKTLSYAVNMASIRYAHEHGADDVIFTSSDGLVLEGPTSTVVLAEVKDGVKTLLTPELESGILPGTTQSALFDAAAKSGWQLGYGPLQPDRLHQADGVWLVSSIRLLAPVRSIDGKAIPVSRELTAELAALVETVL